MNPMVYGIVLVAVAAIIVKVCYSAGYFDGLRGRNKEGN